MKECENIMALHQKLTNSDRHTFTQKGTKVNVSEKQGVYIIYSAESVVLYVGTTKISFLEALTIGLLCQAHIGTGETKK